MHILINHNELQPQTNYTVDVQATYCPEYLLQGPWSEWSSTANWKTKALNVKGSLMFKVASILKVEAYPNLFESVLCVYVLHVSSCIRFSNRKGVICLSKTKNFKCLLSRYLVAHLPAHRYCLHFLPGSVLFTENVSIWNAVFSFLNPSKQSRLKT